ncbi:MAG: hypothetical protein U1G07_21215 [Verrucomicrobiota bacterium]
MDADELVFVAALVVAVLAALVAAVVIVSTAPILLAEIFWTLLSSPPSAKSLLG